MSLWERNISSSNPSWIPNQSLPKNNSSLALLRGCAFRKEKTEFQTGISTIEHLDLHDLANCFPCWHLGPPGIPTIHWTLLGLMLRKTPTQRKVIFRWSHHVQKHSQFITSSFGGEIPFGQKNIASGFWAPCHTKPPSCNTLPWGWAKSITVLRYAWKTLRLRRLEMGRWKCLKNHSKITWFRGGASKSSGNLTNFCTVKGIFVGLTSLRRAYQRCQHFLKSSQLKSSVWKTQHVDFWSA